MTTKLQGRLEALYGLERRKDKLGLDGTRALLAALGDPQRRFRSVHVAGTNGKGSVCALVERVLREAGCRTGLFTSPHLVDFRERIRVRGRWADEDWLESALDRIGSLPEGRDRTFFEVTTALGFLYFAEQDVDWGVVEVGLGGRLDSTNVLEPDVSVITRIALDHTEILGDTLEKIAAEKAGIIKPGVPVVSGRQYPAAELVLREFADRAGVSVRIGEAGGVHRTDLHGPDLESLHTFHTHWGVVDFDQRSYSSRILENTQVALETLRVLEEKGLALPSSAVSTGLAVARWPGRLERCPMRPRLWWDGAHNLEGIQTLLGNMWFHTVGPRKPDVIVLALARDKDATAILDFIGLAPPRTLIVTRTRSERAREPGDLAELADVRGLRVEMAPDIRTAVDRGLELAGDGFVLLTGSLFAVGEAMEAFGGAPGEML